MTREQILDYFLHKPGTFDDEDKSYTSLNLASESVCKIDNNNKLIIELKCDLSFSRQIQEKFKKVQPGNTEGEFQWNKIELDSDISDKDLLEIIDTSYDEVLNKLPLEEQEEILDLEW